jgi:hypothetical protein
VAETRRKFDEDFKEGAVRLVREMEMFPVDYERALQAGKAA